MRFGRAPEASEAIELKKYEELEELIVRADLLRGIVFLEHRNAAG